MLIARSDTGTLKSEAQHQKTPKVACVLLTTAIGMLLVSGQAAALDTIPEESGLSGFFNVGVSVTNMKNNMIAGNSLSTLTKRTTDSIFSSPDDRTTAAPLVNFDLRYTFASSRTQILLGQDLLDVIRFDFNTGLGVAQELGDKSVITAKYLFPSMPTKVWADPYIGGGQHRSKTDRKANGARLAWSGILGSKFSAQFTYWDISIDDEDSGLNLGLNGQQRNLLRRKGEAYDYVVRYTIDLGGGHFLEPGFRYTDNDLKGRAMKNTDYTAQLNYLYEGSGFHIAANARLGRTDYDTTNPIYQKTRDNDTYGVGGKYFYHNPFGLKDWSAVFGAAWYEGDSNTNFYNTNLLNASISALYSF